MEGLANDLQGYFVSTDPDGRKTCVCNRCHGTVLPHIDGTCWRCDADLSKEVLKDQAVMYMTEKGAR